MIFTFFSFQEIPRSHLKCSSILGSLAKRPREDQLILVSICVSSALTLGLIVFVAVHCRRQMKSCFDPRGLVSIENNTQNHGLRTPRESFFSIIPNFWAWADKLRRNFLGPSWVFLVELQHISWHSESLVHGFEYVVVFST